MVCFSLMIILDNSTTHIGIVALTVKESETKQSVSFLVLGYKTLLCINDIPASVFFFKKNLCYPQQVC